MTSESAPSRWVRPSSTSPTALTTKIASRRKCCPLNPVESFRLHASAAAYPCAVATTITERALLIDGEWVETGEWVEVPSPYDGSIVGRVARAGAAETRRAIDAAERAMAEPLPAHKRAEILVRVAATLGRRADEAAQLISAEAGKPLKAARVEVARAMSTYTMAAVQARTLTGQMVPMDASQAGEGKLAFRAGSASRSASSARSRPSIFR